MKRLIIAALAMVLCGCEKSPVETTRTNNSAVTVDLLFTKNGCTIYRFEDGGRSHYFADCRGSVTTERTEYCGKNCYRHTNDEVPTGI